MWETPGDQTMPHRSVHHAAVAAFPSVVPGQREKRSAPRVGCSISLGVELEGERIASTMHDLSATGAAIMFSAPVALGHVVNLRFALPTAPDDEIRCAGLVRSVRMHRGSALAGVEFHHLDAARRRAIAAWVRDEIAPEPGDIARNHWRGEIHASEAFVVPASERARMALRWQPGMASLFRQVAQHLAEQDRVFVPYIGKDLSEGDRIYLEVVPPACHYVFRVLAEVVWVQREPNGAWDKGVGLRLAGLTPMDRHMLEAQLRYFRDEKDRFR
jgi:hypothetical protein